MAFHYVLLGWFYFIPSRRLRHSSHVLCYAALYCTWLPLKNRQKSVQCHADSFSLRADLAEITSLQSWWCLLSSPLISRKPTRKCVNSLTVVTTYLLASKSQKSLPLFYHKKLLIHVCKCALFALIISGYSTSNSCIDACLSLQDIATFFPFSLPRHLCVNFSSPIISTPHIFPELKKASFRNGSLNNREAEGWCLTYLSTIFGRKRLIAQSGPVVLIGPHFLKMSRPIILLLPSLMVHLFSKIKINGKEVEKSISLKQLK